MSTGDKYQKCLLRKIKVADLLKLIDDSTDEIIVKVNFDVYDVLVAWEVKLPGSQHAIKKLLMPGERHQKTQLQDLKESIDAINRDIEIVEIGNQYTYQQENTNEDSDC